MNTLIDGLRVVFMPTSGWQAVAKHNNGVVKLLLGHAIPLALIPAVCWYIGVTQMGWEVSGEVMKLTPESALAMCVLFYFAMLGGVVFLAFMVHWMSMTYGERRSFADGFRLITYTATPFFLAGFIGLRPELWVDLLVGLGVACYCIYLLYRGTPFVMHLSEDRSFLYASAVFAVALVAFVALLGVTVVLWDFGPSPEYTY